MRGEDAAEGAASAEFDALRSVGGEEVDDLFGGPGHEDELPAAEEEFGFGAGGAFPDAEVVEGDAEEVGVLVELGGDEDVEFTRKDVDPVGLAVMGEFDELL